MRAGRRRNRVSFERQQTGKSSIGEPIVQWVAFASAWVELVDLSGREVAEKIIEVAKITSRIMMRYRPDIDERCRVVYNGVIYNIVAAQDPDGRRRELILMCERVR
ncbi:phage head closure protein [Leeia sp. TBRC 13508]|uniref:Phage head closure protein n=1 Tax=Leeia speluncae TaxID=2884804 RepID=A0ABS8D7W6_9NEIS|nr:phage head closure protein [Leeia speluncae]MCB6184283.1 phage head closure protein [Leeia speluncae]